jgi:hypothetical protein
VLQQLLPLLPLLPLLLLLLQKPALASALHLVCLS